MPFVGFSPIKNIATNQLDIGAIDSVILTNGIYDEIKADRNGDLEYSTVKEVWGVFTRLLATFDGNLNGGNVDFQQKNITAIRVKRRKVDDFNNWWTLVDIPYNAELSFETFDYLTESDTEYEYAFVPLTSDGTEGLPSTNTILSEFDGTFIADKKNSYRLLYNLSYGNVTRTTSSAKFETLGSKYPIVVNNADINYEEGSITALVLSTDTVQNNGVINKKKEVENRRALLDFLTNKKSKIIKDSNGNMWLCIIIDNPSIEYLNELNQAIANIQFSFVQIGNHESREDMYYNDMIERAD